MKKIIFLLLAAMAMAVTAPAARAFDRDTWHESDKTLHNLTSRMDGVYAARDRWGASPRVRDQMAQLRDGIADLAGRVRNHAGDRGAARKLGENLSDLMSRVEAEYQAHAHHENAEAHRLDREW